jgi:hypothetical protein
MVAMARRQAASRPAPIGERACSDERGRARFALLADGRRKRDHSFVSSSDAVFTGGLALIRVFLQQASSSLQLDWSARRFRYTLQTSLFTPARYTTRPHSFVTAWFVESARLECVIFSLDRSKLTSTFWTGTSCARQNLQEHLKIIPLVPVVGRLMRDVRSAHG